MRIPLPDARICDDDDLRTFDVGLNVIITNFAPVVLLVFQTSQA